MAARALRNDEIAGLALAVAAHVGLVAWLVLAPPRPAPLPLPERVAVTLSDNLGPEATTPDPSSNPAADGAPELGVAPPKPEPVVEPVPPPPPKSNLSLAQKQIPPKTASKAPIALPRQGQSGASSFADMFKDGVPGGSGKGQSDAKPSSQQQSAIRVSINSQVLRPWNACAVTGIDIEKLRARVSFSLDRNGNVIAIGEPVLSGLTESNRPQAGRFGECAVRAIKVGAPYRLPPEFYEYWKNYNLTFDKKWN
jgi:hypothetical protein